MLSISLLYPKKSFTPSFKTAEKKRFFNGAISNSFLRKQKKSILINW